ncbi:MAG: IMPACT family protein [Eubacteriales bacterium]
MDGYITSGNGRSEFTEKKSVFIGSIRCVTTEAEARAFISEVSSEFSDATHNVFCYILREGNVIRFSDDGEPGGTAGKPALEVLTREGVRDTCLVVTRYFGGIKLGAGGLVRAYAASAKKTLDAAGKCRMMPFLTAEALMGYSDWAPAEDLLKRLPCEVDGVEYGTDVSVRLLLPAEALGRVKDALADLTAGRALFEVTGEVLRGVKEG